MIKKLIKLLEKAKFEQEFSWLSDIDLEKAEFTISEKAIPLEKIKYIYSHRGKTNKTTGESIVGFNRLLKKLNSSQVKFISMNRMIDIEEFEYLIFTDSNLTELVGVLKFPNKNGGKS